MGNLIAIAGESGSGKSTSARNLNPKETFIINVANKPLPIRGYKKLYSAVHKDKEGNYVGNLYNTSDPGKILSMLKIINAKMPHIKTILLEDAQYIMAFETMKRSDEKGYEKFTQIATHFFDILNYAKDMREDATTCVLAHSENIGDGLNPKFKIKTIGKMIDNMITLEGIFTYVLFSISKLNDNDMIEYKFITQSDGTTTAKTPMGCFDDLYIDNDLSFVLEKIDEYNNG